MAQAHRRSRARCMTRCVLYDLDERSVGLLANWFVEAAIRNAVRFRCHPDRDSFFQWWLSWRVKSARAQRRLEAKG
jgi:hypothetical protein